MRNAILALAVGAIITPLTAGAADFGPKTLGNWRYGDTASIKDGKLGSYAQWNAAVGVTVAHVPTRSKIYEVPCADIKFFAARGTPLAWATPELGEGVVAVGSAIIGRGAYAKIEPQAIYGKLDSVSIAICDGGGQFLVQSGKTLAGMSGGPVFRVSDGKAIGITKGYTDSPEHGLQGSVLIPYNVLQAAWSLAIQEVPSLTGL
jgi:hypothetical protein